MKISDLNMLTRAAPPAQSAEVRQQPAQKNVFANLMSNMTRQNCDQRLAEMRGEIARQGAILADRKDIMELKRYKQMLAEFMQEAVRFAYELKKKPGRDGRGRHKMYAIIKVINEKLDKMTQEILADQSEVLQLMADIEDINGLLLDLLA